MPVTDSMLLELFEQAALAAGKAILEVHRAGPEYRLKADCSPVTEADERAEAIILAALAKACPDIPVVAEEAAAAGRVPDIAGGTFILVDPLDGTKEFISGRNDFTVNIALIEAGSPVMGVVYAPALDVAYRGGRDGAIRLDVAGDLTVTRRTPIQARPPAVPPVAVASRTHSNPETDAYLKKSGAAEICCIGSSLKFCLLAEGKADLYPRFSRTMEWDTAAGDAILRAAGGITLELDGTPLRYGKTGQPTDADFANPHFIARGAAG
jgi:3'(2'), 5'-bisphosphate nucleotidase